MPALTQQPLLFRTCAMTVFESTFEIAAPLARVWEFHQDPVSLPRVMTGPVRMRVLHVDRPIHAGSVIKLSMQIGPVAIPWHLRVRERVDGESFVDEQLSGRGPFKAWTHTHRFAATESGGTRVTDRIDYVPPLGPLGAIADALFGKLAMRLMFAGRRKATRALLE